jgi:hypothetical protein
MATDTLRVQAPRLVLMNLTTLEELEAWANPPALSEQRAAQLNRLSVPGLGHQPLHYGGTGNRRLADLELIFDRRTHPYADLEAARQFLDALLVPVRTTVPAAPPRVLFVWPKLVSLEVATESVELVHEHFAVDGSPMAMTAKLAFEHVVEMRALAAGGQ